MGRTSRSGSGGKVGRDGELSADRPQLVWIFQDFFGDGESPVSSESVGIFPKVVCLFCKIKKEIPKSGMIPNKIH